MVLPNASNQTSDQSFDDEPPSDTDLYDDSKSSSSKSQYFIDTTNLPKPIPFIGSLLGYPRRFKQEVHLKVLLASRELGRTLKQDEVDALAYWLAKRQAITSWGAPVGFAGGCWRAYDTAKTHRFPFWQPSSNNFKVNQFGPLRGHPAILCWHTLRALAYGLTGDFIGRLLFGSYAMSTSAVGASNDPRLYEYMNSIKDKVRELSAKDKRTRDPVDNFGRLAEKPYENTVDDSNPTSNEGMFYNELYSPSDQTSDKKDFPKTERWKMAKPVPPLPQKIETDPFDDIYKSSPSGVSEMSDNSGAEDSRVSVWERIRSGQHTPLSNSLSKSSRTPWPKLTQKNKSDYDEFSYSQTDEERSYAENEAQQKFDARIDRERNGRNTT
ncbi:hypothetical protein HI914_01996 [Erysiphe necator]|nr:hypothetical protein HI914_01996 [Erysiphe necator]